MKTNIEKEYAVLLSREEYLALTKAFNYEEVHQTNYYYSSNDKNIGIRIRTVNDTNIFTMKVKDENNNYVEYEMQLDEISLDNKSVKEVLSRFHQENPRPIGILKNKRLIYKMQYGELALDQSEYLGHIDYEIEYELYDHRYEGINEFLDLLKKYHITFIENLISKYARFIKRRNELKVAILNADGTEESEALIPYDLLSRANITVELISINETKYVTSSHGVNYICKKTIKEANKDDYSTIILPGGMPGTINLKNHVIVNEWIDDFYQKKKLIAAICAAPNILISKGLLNDNEFTVFPGFENDKHPAKSYVYQKDNMITAKSMGHAIEFSKKIIANLKNEEIANQTIGEIMQVNDEQ